MISKVRNSLVDPIGQLYEGNEKFYRAINQNSEAFVKKLMQSGLIEQLVAEKLFPRTAISTKKIEGYSLVLEHEKIGLPTYPFEWSPEMLRAAGNCVACVNDISNRLGYELKDAHPFNVVFDGCRPIFVDFGSFKDTSYGRRGDWIAYMQFEKMFRYPLYFYSKYSAGLFRRAFLVPASPYEASDYLAFRYSALRLLPRRPFRSLVEYYEKFINFACIDVEKALGSSTDWKVRALKSFQKLNVIPLRARTSKYAAKKLRKIELKTHSTWGDYQLKAGHIDATGKISLNRRFGYVIELLKSRRPAQVIELGCNQGVLTEHIARLDFVERIVSCDVDEQALDSLFKRVKSQGLNINPMALNFMLPRRNTLSGPVEKRARGDMVLALAVTHHLALTQGFTFDTIFQKISKYTRRDAIVEFMPLGLWNGKSAPPFPDWYSENNFRQALERRFSILKSDQVQANRIVYLIEKK